jgi:hypothetical protein
MKAAFHNEGVTQGNLQRVISTDPETEDVGLRLRGTLEVRERGDEAVRFPRERELPVKSRGLSGLPTGDRIGPARVQRSANPKESSWRAAPWRSAPRRSRSRGPAAGKHRGREQAQDTAHDHDVTD